MPDAYTAKVRSVMALIIVLAVVLVTSTSVLLREYATRELAPPDAPDTLPQEDVDAPHRKAA